MEKRIAELASLAMVQLAVEADESVATLQELAKLCRATGKYDAAIKALGELLDLNPLQEDPVTIENWQAQLDCAQTMVDLGQVYHQLHRNSAKGNGTTTLRTCTKELETSLKFLHDALEKRREVVEVLNNENKEQETDRVRGLIAETLTSIAVIYKTMGNISQAEVAHSEALKLHSSVALLCDTQSWTWENGKWEQGANLLPSDTAAFATNSESEKPTKSKSSRLPWQRSQSRKKGRDSVTDSSSFNNVKSTNKYSILGFSKRKRGSSSNTVEETKWDHYTAEENHQQKSATTSNSREQSQTESECNLENNSTKAISDFDNDEERKRDCIDEQLVPVKLHPRNSSFQNTASNSSSELLLNMSRWKLVLDTIALIDSSADPEAKHEYSVPPEILIGGPENQRIVLGRCKQASSKLRHKYQIGNGNGKYVPIRIGGQTKKEIAKAHVLLRVVRIREPGCNRECCTSRASVEQQSNEINPMHVRQTRNCRQPVLLLEDLNSMCGVSVNGVRIRKVVLQSGDKIRIGGCKAVKLGCYHGTEDKNTEQVDTAAAATGVVFTVEALQTLNDVGSSLPFSLARNGWDQNSRNSSVVASSVVTKLSPRHSTLPSKPMEESLQDALDVFRVLYYAELSNYTTTIKSGKRSPRRNKDNLKVQEWFLEALSYNIPFRHWSAWIGAKLAATLVQ